jgi:hypothetical protein
MGWINKQIDMKGIILKIIILSGLLFYSCINTDDKLNKYIEIHCSFYGSDTCYINIKEALKIDYNRMYLFGETTTANEISKILGIPYKNNKYIPDSKYRIILLKNNKIIYEDDYYQKNVSFFSLENRVEVNFYCALYTTSNFWVEKREHNGKYPYFYLLRPIE